ncbi:hypothetical protein [Tomitella cavernea]|nr:hypothetical protein [Tomitella cavernea]
MDEVVGRLTTFAGTQGTGTGRLSTMADTLGSQPGPVTQGAAVAPRPAPRHTG